MTVSTSANDRPRAFRLRETVSSFAPVSKRIFCPSTSTSAANPHSPNPASASMVDRILMSTCFAAVDAAGCASTTVMTTTAQATARRSIMPRSLQQPGDRGSALAATCHRRHARGRGKVGGAIDSRDDEVELGSLVGARQDHADWMKQVLALHSRPLLDAIGNGAKRVLVGEPR